MAVKARPLVISYLRFSGKEQGKGDTTRRQKTGSQEWVSARDLVIDDNFRLADEGVSAFRGANVSDTAALGRLLKMVKAKQIPAGSILLVESLDRLSRQEILPALEIFITLLNG